MSVVRIEGVAPFVPASRPRADTCWWHASGVLDGGALIVERLSESDTTPKITGVCGVDAPLTLPAAFVESLPGDPLTLSRARLLRAARAFAAGRPRSQRHPLRHEGESASALERRRLIAFAAARALAKHGPVEVDVVALLRAADLPWRGLAGAHQDAITRRARILDALREQALGPAVDVRPRDLAVAAWPALRAVIAAAGAARYRVTAAP